MHTSRYSSATHLLEVGPDIRAVQEFLGHKYVPTQEIYTAVLGRGADGVFSLPALPEVCPLWPIADL